MSEKSPKRVRQFLRPNEVQECEQDKRQIKSFLDNRHYDKRAQHQNLYKSLQQVEKRLQQAPPDLSAEQKDTAHKTVQKLESKIKEGMLSHEEMRRNPIGAVSQHRRWEKANKEDILAWKNLQVAMMKGAPQEDVAAAINVGRLRPRTSQLNMDGAQIPVTTTYSFPTPQYQEGWERIFGASTDEKQSMLVRLEEFLQDSPEEQKTA